MLPPPERLTVFVKAPRPGFVKTRLATALGAAGAAVAYSVLVDRLMLSLRGLPFGELRFAPDDAHADIEHWLPQNWRSTPQGEGDLGARLQRAFTDSFTDGAGSVVIIGSDCPDVAISDVHEAWNALTRHDLVLGPAADGGYWLIGLRRDAPGLFHNMPWSSDAVLRETTTRATALHLTVHNLRVLRDVDNLDDWEAFAARPALGTSTPARDQSNSDRAVR